MTARFVGLCETMCIVPLYIELYTTSTFTHANVGEFLFLINRSVVARHDALGRYVIESADSSATVPLQRTRFYPCLWRGRLVHLRQDFVNSTSLKRGECPK